VSGSTWNALLHNTRKLFNFLGLQPSNLSGGFTLSHHALGVAMGKAGTGPWHSARIGPRRHRRSCTVMLLDPLQVRNGSSLSCSSLSHLYPLSLSGLPMDPSSDGCGSLSGPAGSPAHSWCGGLSCSFPCPLLFTGLGGAGKVVVEGPGVRHLHILWGICQDLMVGWVLNHSQEFGMPCTPLMGYPLEALS
jgi:hypothetical protein